MTDIPSDATPKQVLDYMRHNRALDPERIGQFIDMSPADRDEMLFRIVTLLTLKISEIEEHQT